ncbi:MAG: hypothetical protein IAG13_04950 [Deltaproteobacteria bacterium]|nr:hypothetical protein [Nannocystaceae bacterium]
MIHTPAELPPALRRDGYLFVYARTYAGVRVIGSVLRIAVDHEGDIAGVVLVDVELVAGGVRTAARSSAEARAMLEQELSDEAGRTGQTVSIRSAELVYETGCPADRAAAAPVLYASTTSRSRGGLFSSDQRRTLSMVHPRPRLEHPRCVGRGRLGR